MVMAFFLYPNYQLPITHYQSQGNELGFSQILGSKVPVSQLI
ncbi:hypothetical protein NIES4074_11250 [Cylindrospermum sp. NIES-4074]|nr:hypothetical protein NIES4074_11250 [Cylindrospermum sp. NIES-4074]